MPIRLADSVADHHFVQALWHEYRDYLHEIDCYDCGGDNIDEELSRLSKLYNGKETLILLAEESSNAAGTIAVQKINKHTAELRRLFVRPDCRAQGIGRQLLERATHEAKARGYTKILLDTFRSKKEPQALYKKLGFNECPPYNDLPAHKILFMEKHL